MLLSYDQLACLFALLPPPTHGDAEPTSKVISLHFLFFFLSPPPPPLQIGKLSFISGLSGE